MAVVFRYAGYNMAGQKVKGVVVANTRAEASVLLERRGIYASSIRKVPAWLTRVLPVSGKNLSIFFSGLARLVRSGLDMSTAVDLLAKEQFNPRIALILYQVRDALEEGHTVSGAFAKAGVFKEDVIAMMKVGEESGKIADVFESLAHLFEEKERIKSSVMKSLAYPAFLLIGATGGLMYIVPNTVLPVEKLLKSFSRLKGMETDLPVLTKGTIAVVHFLVSYGIYLLFTLVFMAVLFGMAYRKQRSFKAKVDNLLLRLPLVGGLLQRLFVYRTLLSVHLLYSAGVEMARAFRMIEKLQGIEVFRKDVEGVRRKVEEGVDFVVAVGYSRLLPESYKTLLKVGARSGSLTETLRDLTKYARETFLSYSEFVTKVTAPLALVLVAVVVGVVLLAVYMPIFNMVELIKSSR